MKDANDDLRCYRTRGLTLLQFMLVLGSLGLVASACLHYLLCWPSA